MFMPSTQPLMPGSRRYEEREWLMAQGEDWWADVFDRIACGVSPKAICDEYALRYAILARVIGETEARQGEYVAALEIASDGYAHEVVAIADDGSNDTYVDDDGMQHVNKDVIARSKLRIDTRLKLAGKWFRGRYGETVKVEHAGTVLVDAGLVGFASELLERLTRPGERVLEHVVDVEPEAIAAESVLKREPHGELLPQGLSSAVAPVVEDTWI